MITLKTNTKKIVVERTGEEQFVYMNISGVTLKKIRVPATLQDPEQIVTGYVVPINYYFIREVDTGEVDENNDPIMREQKVPLAPVPPLAFTQTEAQGIEQMMGGLTETYHTERFIQLILGGINHQLTVTQPYLTGASGWTVQ